MSPIWSISSSARVTASASNDGGWQMVTGHRAGRVTAPSCSAEGVADGEVLDAGDEVRLRPTAASPAGSMWASCWASLAEHGAHLAAGELRAEAEVGAHAERQHACRRWPGARRRSSGRSKPPRRGWRSGTTAGPARPSGMVTPADLGVLGGVAEEVADRRGPADATPRRRWRPASGSSRSAHSCSGSRSMRLHAAGEGERGRVVAGGGDDDVVPEPLGCRPSGSRPAGRWR